MLAYLTDEHEIGESVTRELAAGDQDAHGDRQVQTGSGLGDVRRGQVDGDALEGQREARVGQGRMDPLAAFAHGSVGQADRGERRQPADRHQRSDEGRRDDQGRSDRF